MLKFSEQDKTMNICIALLNYMSLQMTESPFYTMGPSLQNDHPAIYYKIILTI